MKTNKNVTTSLNTNPEEETKMLEQVQRFNDIAKQIEEIDAVGGDVYVGGFKVSWESVKQFIYGLDDEELKLLAYSNKPEIPAELEAYAIYLLEAEKAWDNELTMQNSYFNSKKNISMDLQFFASKEKEEETEMENEINKEEVKMNTFNGEIKDLVEGTVGRALIIDQGNEYLIKPYMLEIDPTTGDVSCRKYAPYTLDKEWEGFEYVLYFEEEEDDWVEETFKDPVFGNNEEEEETMNEIVEVLLSNYFGEKVELISEEEEKEMENQREVENMLSQYFQEEVKLENKKEDTNMKMDLQFFSSKGIKEVDIKDIKGVETIPTGDAIMSDLGDKYLIEPYKIERDEEGNVSRRHYSPYTIDKKWKGYQFPLYFEEEVSLTSKHEELVKLHEQTWKESVREPRVKLDVSTKK